MHIKVYFLDKVIYLHDKKPSQTDKANINTLKIEGKDDVEKAISAIKNKTSHPEFHLWGKNLEALLQIFSAFFNIIEAAGGIVRNSNNHILMIFRNGYWDLPKGKLEVNEGIADAAIREVMEECGIEKGLKIVSKAQTTYHYYQLKGKDILKKTYWYNMSCSYNGKLNPQTLEGITKVEWVAQQQLAAKLNDSYDSIKDLLKGTVT